MKLPITLSILFALAGLAGCGNDKDKKAAEVSRHLSAAKTYQQQGQYRSAMLEGRNVLKLAPDNLETLKLLAKIHNDIGAYTVTIQMLEKLQDQRPDVRGLLAEAYVGSKKFNSALKLLENAGAPPKDEQSLDLLAQLKFMNRDVDGLSQVIEAFKSLAPASETLLFLQASQAAMNAKYDEAKTLTEALLAKNPSHVKGMVLLANLAMYEKDMPKAEELLIKAQNALPKVDIMTTSKVMVISQLAEVMRLQDRVSEYYAYQKSIAEANPEGDLAQQKYNQASELYQKGQYAEAATILNELHTQYPQDKNTATLLAMVGVQQGTNESAAELFDKFIDPETASPAVLQAATVAKFRTKNKDAALDMLKKAAETQPLNGGVQATYGLALLDKNPKDLEGAKILEKSLAMAPEQHRLRIVLARHYQLMGNDALSLGQLEKAFASKPDDFLVQKTYFTILLESKSLPKLKSELDKLPATSSRTRFWRGWLEMEQKNAGGAEKFFNEALVDATAEDKPLILTGIAQAKETQKDYPAAIAAWQKILQDNPSSELAYGRLIALSELSNKTPEAVKFIEDLAQKVKGWEPEAVLTQVSLRQKNLPAAIKHAEAGLEKSQNSQAAKNLAAYVYIIESSSYKAAAKLREAKASLLKAVKLAPENPDYLAALIELELSNKNIPEAQKLLDQFPKTDDNLAGTLYLQGVIRLAEGKPEEAFKLYQQAWAKAPLQKPAEGIVTYYQAHKQFNEARAFVDEWLTKQPENIHAMLLKAMNEQQENRAPAAIALYEKVLKKTPDALVPMNNLAWLYFETKDPRALPLAKRAAELAPEAPEILDTYGWILAQSGNKAQALPVLEKAHNKAPDNKEIAEHLNSVKTRGK